MHFRKFKKNVRRLRERSEKRKAEIEEVEK